MRLGLALTALAALVLTLATPIAAQAAVPTATVSISSTTLRQGDTAAVVVQFSEAVTGVSTSTVTSPHGVLGVFASVDGGVTWTSTFSPFIGIVDNTNVISLDLAGVRSASTNEQGVGTAQSGNYAIDTRSASTVHIDVSPAVLAIDDVALVTMTFSSPPVGFSLADLTVSAGVASGLAATAHPLVYTAMLTPTSNFEGGGTVSIASGSYLDSLGNAGIGATSNTYTVDTLRPTATVSLSHIFLRAGEAATATFSFSEPVSISGSPTASNGTLGPLSSSDGLTWTATLTPTANVTAYANAVALDMTGVTDGAGNAGFGTATSGPYAVTTVRPTGFIGLSDLLLTSGEASTVTVFFDTAVLGLPGSAVTAPGGAIGPWSSSDGGFTWTGLFTPTAGTSTAGNIVSLDLSGVTNADGNAGVGTAVSTSYRVDTVRPTLVIDVADVALAPGESTTVTFRFSRGVGGFTSADVTTLGGTLAPFAAVPGEQTYTTTFTAGPVATSASITADLTRVFDEVGNRAATAAGVSPSITISAGAVPPAAAPAPAALASAGATVDGGLFAALALLLLGAALIARRPSRA